MRIELLLRMRITADSPFSASTSSPQETHKSAPSSLNSSNMSAQRPPPWTSCVEDLSSRSSAGVSRGLAARPREALRRRFRAAALEGNAFGRFPTTLLRLFISWENVSRFMSPTAARRVALNILLSSRGHRSCTFQTRWSRSAFSATRRSAMSSGSGGQLSGALLVSCRVASALATLSGELTRETTLARADSMSLTRQALLDARTLFSAAAASSRFASAALTISGLGAHAASPSLGADGVEMEVEVDPEGMVKVESYVADVAGL
mmetsp:Transcript_39389/g.116805  ORF Transcript_39389/g.116805 Transcript_39389/m.116805 type:complete len:264 (+) Transcript_39389:85-876(+)